LRNHNACEMIVGPRVAFGKKRAGRLPLLRELGRRHDVGISVVPSVGQKSGVVASRKIRQWLQKGRVEKAAQALGYPYSVAGTVVSGDRRGRRLGFPTANISVDERKILPPGVFWVKVLPANAPFPLSVKDLKHAKDGLCNVGTRPTFSPQGKTIHCEAYIFGARGSLYGKRLRVVFMRRLRSEKRFASSQALVRQIEGDLMKAKRWASK
jgi:riboflavin kinase / FMN adenylyltransferase